MRLLYFGNNWVGWKVAEWLHKQCEAGEPPDEIVGLVLHPEDKRRYGDEIIRSLSIDPANIFEGSRLRESEVIEAIQALHPDLGISILFGYILRAELLRVLPAGCINLHPSLLPYNRGAYPNVWSIIDGTPSGVTLHYIDEGVDTGDIIAQRQVEVEPVDTGQSLYQKLEQTCVDLFQDTWPHFRAGEGVHKSQSNEEGTSHRVRDAEKIDEIDLDRSYTAKELIDLLRARTFPPHHGAYFRHGDRKVYLRLQLYYEGEENGLKADNA
jgi:methionyl-tRNA formyltransferase